MTNLMRPVHLLVFSLSPTLRSAGLQHLSHTHRTRSDISPNVTFILCSPISDDSLLSSAFSALLLTGRLEGEVKSLGKQRWGTVQGIALV